MESGVLNIEISLGQKLPESILAYEPDIDGLMQERRNSSALAMELRLPCINPSI